MGRTFPYLPCVFQQFIILFAVVGLLIKTRWLSDVELYFWSPLYPNDPEEEGPQSN